MRPRGGRGRVAGKRWGGARTRHTSSTLVEVVIDALRALLL